MTARANWTSRPLKDLVQPVTKVDPASSGRTSFRYIDIGSVDGSQHRIVDPAWTPSAGAPGRARQLVHTGDTVFSTVRPYLEKIAHVDRQLDGEIASTGFCVLRPRSEVVEPRFLFHFMTSRLLLDQVLPLQRGVSYPAVRDKDVLAATTPIPPMSEQVRIVDILEDHLSRLDAADNSLQRARQRSRSLSAAVLDSVVSDSDTQCALGDLVERVEAGRSYGGSAPPARPDEWGIIKVSAMTWGEFRASENKAVPSSRADPRYEIKVGDLLVSRANTSAYVGAAVLVRDTRARLLLSDKSLRLVLRPGVAAEWLQLALSAPTTRRQISARATGTKDSMRNISQSALLGVCLPLKSAASQAADVARCRERLDAADGFASSATVAIKRTRSLRRSLLAAAFSGRLTGRASDMDLAEELVTSEAR